MRYGIMTQDISQGRGSLALQEGQRVRLQRAMNQPDKSLWFASPADGKWSSGLTSTPGDYDSILLEPGDCTILNEPLSTRDLLDEAFDAICLLAWRDGGTLNDDPNVQWLTAMIRNHLKDSVASA